MIVHLHLIILVINHPKLNYVYVNIVYKKYSGNNYPYLWIARMVFYLEIFKWSINKIYNF
jgi:hypothetical protein